ncbi:unnamed protein product [Rotaria sordida]|uniref:Saposin B-type domain-containing protein n=1 Tax=Rotaria sordida TaxID=392033 RepID=A0A813WVL0_9BILA|nr:unnamed protein product [Rotaria sordida]CAF0861221.1 unnamed protein product [Rotaria sordida]
MYKALTILILVMVGVACASHSYNTRPKKFQRLSSSLNHKKVGIDLCPTCINEVVELINIVLNIILDEGIVASCGDLCGFVANRTGSKILGDICDLACDAFGIDEFVKLIIKADIDPIYYCQLVDMCPINDHGDAKFTNFGVLPQTAPQGTTFVLDLSFMTVNGTGTGTFTFNIINPKNESSGNLYWFEAKKPGTYIEKLGIKTYALSDCDPSKGKNAYFFVTINCLISCVILTGLCDAWPVGTYRVTAQICNGDCGSHHPHTSIYDSKATSFVITKKQ